MIISKILVCIYYSGTFILLALSLQYDSLFGAAYIVRSIWLITLLDFPKGVLSIPRIDWLGISDPRYD